MSQQWLKLSTQSDHQRVACVVPVSLIPLAPFYLQRFALQNFWGRQLSPIHLVLTHQTSNQRIHRVSCRTRTFLVPPDRA
jgi:hypothetical protein